MGSGERTAPAAVESQEFFSIDVRTDGFQLRKAGKRLEGLNKNRPAFLSWVMRLTFETLGFDVYNEDKHTFQEASMKGKESSAMTVCRLGLIMKNKLLNGKMRKRRKPL